MPRFTKYCNTKVKVDDIWFDSMKEANRYMDLKLLERAGEIHDLQLQVKYVLIPEHREPDTVGKRGGVRKGKLIEKECTYTADFVYKTADGIEIVEDVKGFRTEVYKLKKKLMYHVYGIRIKEV